MVLMTASPSVPASIQRRAFSAISVWLGDSLVMMGLAVAARHAATTRADMSGLLPNATPPSPDVRAGYVDFHGVYGRVVEDARDFGVFLDRRARQVGDVSRLAEIERRQDAIDHVARAGILQADGVEHAARRLPHAVRGIAEPRFPGGALETDRSQVAVRESLHARILLAEPDAA